MITVWQCLSMVCCVHFSLEKNKCIVMHDKLLSCGAVGPQCDLNSSHESPILRVVANGRLARLFGFVQPNLATLKRGTIQVHGNGGSSTRIPHLVKPLRVFNKYNATLVKGLILCTLELVVIALRISSIPALLDLALKHFHPAEEIKNKLVHQRVSIIAATRFQNKTVAIRSYLPAVAGMVVNGRFLAWIPAK
jgi:hypothetical protein